MLCDFQNPIEVITFLDVIPKDERTSPRNIPGFPGPQPIFGPPKLPSGWRGSPPTLARSTFEGYSAGSWHGRAPGETRVRLDYSGLVTFYDSSLSSLVEARYGQDRSLYRLEGISALDSNRVRMEMEDVLTREQGRGSGVDWGSIVRVVTERYAARIEYLRFLLSPNKTFEDPLERAAEVRAHLLVMLLPYISTADVPKRLPPSTDSSWAAPIVRRCAITQTSHIPLDMLTPQELRIHAAVENTLYEICRQLVFMWVDFFDIEGADNVTAMEATQVAYSQVDELMGWLDWSAWVRCEPGCSLGVRH